MHSADWHTLFTHKSTIICFSLEEGLTSSHCAYHAGARCHKKHYRLGGFAVKTMLYLGFNNYSPRQPSNFDCSIFDLFPKLFPLIYDKLKFCKSCDGINYNSQISLSTKIVQNLQSVSAFSTARP